VQFIADQEKAEAMGSTPGESIPGEEEVQDTKQEDQDTKQSEELVPFQRLPNAIQKSWSHWYYQNKWRQCDGCRTWGMLFHNFDQSYTTMRQHPVTTVTQRVRSVTNHDSKHMCKACNAHKFFYDDEIDAVYVLRRIATNITLAMAGNPKYWVGWIQWVGHDITSVTMNVASFLTRIDDQKLQKYRRDVAREENRQVQ